MRSDVARRSQLSTALIASLGGLVFGYDSGAMSGALLFLKSAFHLTPFGREAMVSVIIIGAMVGSLIASSFADRIGRRTTLLIASAGAGLFALMAGFSPTYSIFLLARFLVGIAVGLIVVAAPMYISEASRTSSRGGASATFQLAVAIGLTSSYWGDFFFSKSGNWHGMFMVAAIPAALLFLLFLRLPDTPRWYFMHGLRAQAEAALARFNTPEEVTRETARIQGELTATKTLDHGSYRDLLNPKIRMAVVFGVVFSIFQQFSGINTVTYYSPTVFRIAGFPRSDSIFITAVIGLVTILATVLGISLVDRWGRRPLMFSSLTGMGLSMFLLGLAFHIGTQSSGMAYLMIGSVTLYHIAFSFGMGLMGWVLLPEVFPNRLRARGQAVGRFANWVANFTVTISFLSVVAAIGAANTFWLFTAFILATMVFIWRMAPETRHRPLEAIEKYWENGMKWDDTQ